MRFMIVYYDWLIQAGIPALIIVLSGTLKFIVLLKYQWGWYGTIVASSTKLSYSSTNHLTLFREAIVLD